MLQNQIINLKSKSEQYPILCEYAGGCFRLNNKDCPFLGKTKMITQCHLAGFALLCMW